MKKMIIVVLLAIILEILVTCNLIINNKITQLESQVQTVQLTSNDATTNLNIETTDVKKSNDDAKVELYKTYHHNVEDGIDKMVSKTFDENPINIQMVDYEDDLIVGMYIKISGLKNKSIEQKINDNLKKAFVTFLHSIYDDAYDYCYVQYPDSYYKKFLFKDDKLIGNQEVLANFSNVLSFSTSCEEYGGHENITYSNYNLNDASELKIEELFTSNANIYELVTNAFSWLCKDSYEYSDLLKDGLISKKDFEERQIDYGIYYTGLNEVKLQKYTNYFKHNENIEYYFTPAEVELHILKDRGTIRFDKNNCAIYDRFKDDSIFEDKTIGLKDIACFNHLTCERNIKFSRKEDTENVRYEYYILSALNDENANNRIINMINEKIEEDVIINSRFLNENEKLLVVGIFEINKFKCNSSVAEKYIDNSKEIYSYIYNPLILRLDRNDCLFETNNVILDVIQEYETDIIELTLFDQKNINCVFGSKDLSKAIAEFSEYFNYYLLEMGFFLIDNSFKYIDNASYLLEYISNGSLSVFELAQLMFEEKYENDLYLQNYYYKEIDTDSPLSISFSPNKSFTVSVYPKLKSYEFIEKVSIMYFDADFEYDFHNHYWVF